MTSSKAARANHDRRKCDDRLCNDFKCNVNTARMLFPPGEQVKGFGSDPFRPCWGPEGAEFYREETPAGVRNALKASRFYREETPAGVRRALKVPFYREETPLGSGADEAVGSSELFGAGSLRTQDACGPREGTGRTADHCCYFKQDVQSSTWCRVCGPRSDCRSS